MTSFPNTKHSGWNKIITEYLFIECIKSSSPKREIIDLIGQKCGVFDVVLNS